MNQVNNEQIPRRKSVSESDDVWSEAIRSVQEIDLAMPQQQIFEQVTPIIKKIAGAFSLWREDKYFSPDVEQGFSAWVIHEEADHGRCILVTSWAPGLGAPPHTHGTWVVFTSADGLQSI